MGPERMTEAGLKARLEAVRRRLIAIEVLRLLCIGVFAGMSLAAAIMVAHKLSGGAFPGWLCWIPPALAPFWPLALIWRGAPDMFAAARACDGRGDLKERLATWVEAAEGRIVPRDGLVGLLREDALEHGAKVAPAAMFPIGLPAWVGLMAIPLMLCGAAMLMPERRAEAVIRWETGPGIEVTGAAGGGGASAPESPLRVAVSPELILRARLAISGDLAMRTEEKRELLQEIEDRLRWSEGVPKEVLDELSEMAGILRRKVAEESGARAETDPRSPPGSGEGADGRKTSSGPGRSEPVPEITVPEVISLYERDLPEYRDLLAKYFSRREGDRKDGGGGRAAVAEDGAGAAGAPSGGNGRAGGRGSGRPGGTGADPSR
ncbi:MAG: hypothetical protein N3A38_09255 [Planctomycetota bacterium]|nr:hypothetical protein [Planctomycetota bacterium]